MSVIVADRSTSYGLAALAGAVATLAAVSPLISGFGWPSGHDGIWVFPRIAVMAERFALGEVIPVWSSLDNYGLGSPEPIFYNKLFYYPAALIYLAVGSLKLAVVGLHGRKEKVGGDVVGLALQDIGHHALGIVELLVQPRRLDHQRRRGQRLFVVTVRLGRTGFRIGRLKQSFDA